MADQQQSGEEEVRKLLKELELKQAALMAGGAVQRKVANIRAAVFLVVIVLVLGLLFGFYAAVEYLPRALEKKKQESRMQIEPVPAAE